MTISFWAYFLFFLGDLPDSCAVASQRHFSQPRLRSFHQVWLGSPICLGTGRPPRKKERIYMYTPWSLDMLFNTIQHDLFGFFVFFVFFSSGYSFLLYSLYFSTTNLTKRSLNSPERPLTYLSKIPCKSSRIDYSSTQVYICKQAQVHLCMHLLGSW